MIINNSKNDYILKLEPITCKKHVTPFNVKEASTGGRRTYKNLNSIISDRKRAEGLAKVDTSSFFKNKNSFSQRNYNPNFHNHDYSSYVEEG